MRPPGITGGIVCQPMHVTLSTSSFNEAAGYHRRNQRPPQVAAAQARLASMRPPGITGGIPRTEGSGMLVELWLQ